MFWAWLEEKVKRHFMAGVGKAVKDLGLTDEDADAVEIVRQIVKPEKSSRRLTAKE